MGSSISSNRSSTDTLPTYPTTHTSKYTKSKNFSIQLVTCDKPQLFNKDIISIAEIINTKCPLISNASNTRLTPTPFLPSGGSQTIYSAIKGGKVDKYSNIKYDRQVLSLQDGGCVSLDWYPNRPSFVSTDENSSNFSNASTRFLESEKEDPGFSSPIVIIIPGVMGSSREYYIRRLAKSLGTKGPNGCRAVVLNHRGCSRTPLTSVRLHSMDYTGDLQEAVAYLTKTYPTSSLGAIGYSLGANILTRYLGEQGSTCKLSAATAVCCPFDITKIHEQMNKPTFLNKYAIQPNLTKAAKAHVRRHKDVIQSGNRRFDLDALFKAKSVQQVDTLLTAPISGFSSCEQYYREASSSKYVAGIRIPLLAINTRDDPMVPLHGVPVEEFKNNPFTALLILSHGGHLGFFTGVVPKIWYIDPVIEFFSALL